MYGLGSRMKVSQTGIDLIKHFEGLRLEAYQDIAGIWTIGYGHTGSDVSEGMSISEQEAENLLRQDLTRFENGISSAVNVPLGQNQFDALVSLAYNIGINAFRGSTARRLLNKNKYFEAAEAITWWNKASINGRKQEVPGLVRRRAAEAALFLTDLPPEASEEGTVEDETRITPEENTPRRDNVLGSRTIDGAVVAGAGGAAGAGAAMMNGNEGDKNSDTGNDVNIDATNTTDETGSTGETTGTTGDSSTAGDAVEGGETGTSTEIGTPPPADAPLPQDYREAFQIAAGVLVVLAVIYIIIARLDDWFNYRR